MSKTNEKSAKSAGGPYRFFPQYKYEKELIANARKIATPGKGILAADESTGTIAARFKDIKLENTRAHRRAYRHLLFSTPGLEQYISGTILYEETLYEKMEDGRSLVQLLLDKGILLGIKLDKGTKHLPGTDNELYTQGLTDMDERCRKYYADGCRFAKWRAVLRISNSTPSETAIAETVNTLASYAAICQANGLVPIVEPEVLMDGDHSIEVCQQVTEHVLAAQYKALHDHRVLLEGSLLKPNMVLSGQQCKVQAPPSVVAEMTVKTLQRTVPASVSGITFLSGGQSEEEATVNLNAINALPLGPRPWTLTFSYGRALQQSVLNVWQGKLDNVPQAQQMLMVRARANSLASTGQYAGEGANALSQRSNFVQGYTY